jgi:hypothetical protein
VLATPRSLSLPPLRTFHQNLRKRKRNTNSTKLTKHRVLKNFLTVSVKILKNIWPLVEAFANPSRLRKLPKLSDGAVNNTHPMDVGKGVGGERIDL